MNTAPSSDRAAVGAVIVTFYPDAGFGPRLAAIAAEASPVLVIDNSASEQRGHELADLCARTGCELRLHHENGGLGAALNAGFAALAERGIRWAIAFDQDSTPAPGFAAALLATAASGARRADVVGANWTDEATPDRPARHLQPHPVFPFLFRRSAATRDLVEVTCVIASGTLFHLPVWRQLGGFDETLFLDLVDTEYCLRARAAGQARRVAASARMRHRRGAKRAVKFAGGTCWPAFMPEMRLRCLFRNRVLLFRRYVWRAPHWVTFELCYAAKIVAEIILFEDRKGRKLAACLHGTWDGLCGRRGPLPACRG